MTFCGFRALQSRVGVDSLLVPMSAVSFVAQPKECAYMRSANGFVMLLALSACLHANQPASQPAREPTCSLVPSLPPSEQRVNERATWPATQSRVRGSFAEATSVSSSKSLYETDSCMMRRPTQTNKQTNRHADTHTRHKQTSKKADGHVRLETHLASTTHATKVIWPK